MSRGYLFNIDTLQVYPNTRKYSSHSNDCVIIRHPSNLIERYGLRGMLEFADRLFEVHGSTTRVEDHWTVDEFADNIWNLFKEVQGELKVTERSAKRESLRKVSKEGRGPGNYTPGPRRHRWPRTYKLNREAVVEVLRPNSGSRIAAQARGILEAVRAQPLDILTEDQMKQLIEKSVENGFLKTKQSPWRIFLYYEYLLHRSGLLLRQIQREYRSHQDPGWTLRAKFRGEMPCRSRKHPATEEELARDQIEKDKYLKEFGRM